MAVGVASFRDTAKTLMIAAILACLADVADAADAAYAVDTAEVASPGECKVESWISASSNRDFIAVANPSCGMNLLRDFELSAGFVRARTDGEWTTGVAPKLKTNLIPTAIGGWGVGLAATVAYDFTAHQATAYALTIPATLRLSDVVRINVNAGWLFDRTIDQHYFTYGAGVDWRTPDGVWQFTAEVFGLAGAAEERGTVQPRFQTGFRWRPIEPFSIDLVYGRNITGENANWITLATIYRFPPPSGKYEPD
jgi:hypothetical protein